YGAVKQSGRSAQAIAQAVLDGEITALHLFGADPLRDHANRALWEQALHRAGVVVAHASAITDGLREHADVVFPAESYAEKEGTLVHPDGRLQRLRTAIAHPGEVRAGWSVLADIAKRCGLDLGVLTAGMAWKQLAEAVPFYSGLTLDGIGGRGVRWQERDPAKEIDFGDGSSTSEAPEPESSGANGHDGALRLGRYRPISASSEVEISPALHFAIAQQQAELSPEDAQRLNIRSGDEITVAQNGTRLKARAQVRSGVPEGTAFLAEGIEAQSANELTEPVVQITKS